MPTFKTAPEADNAARSPYDDLNRLERNRDRPATRMAIAPRSRNGERSLARQLDHVDERNPPIRAQDRPERALERNGKDLERELDRNTDRHLDRSRAAVAPLKAVQRLHGRSQKERIR